MQLNETTLTALREAKVHVATTGKVGDSRKWAAYCKQDSAGQLATRKAWGHGEFCRLQRLSFHGFI